MEGSWQDSRSLRLLEREVDPPLVAAEPTSAAGDPGDRAVAWICSTLIEGLMHCACAHQVVHPELLDCIEGYRVRQQAAQLEAQP